MKRETGKYFKFVFGMIASFLLFVFVPVSADAEEYKQVQVYDGSARVKVGNYYFWGESNKSWSKGFNIYTSKSAKTKKGTFIGTSARYGASTTCIVTNGAQVLYASRSGNKLTFYSVDVNGKNKKKYGTVPVSSNGWICLTGFCNNRIYYEKISSKITFCYFSTKTKKEKVLIKLKEDESLCTLNGGRYLYSISNNKTKSTIKIYDLKKSKLIKTHSLKKDYKSDNIGGIVGFSGKYFYFVNTVGDYNGNRVQKIYRCAVDGAGSVKLVKTLKAEEIGMVNNSYIYYWTENLNTYNESYSYYRYNFSKKKSEKISASTYDKVLEKAYKNLATM